MSSFEMPTGWRFCPEDIELIRDYLYKKVMGQELPMERVIVECDLYGNENPWQIWERFSEYVVKSFQCEDLYVFTKLKKKNPEAKNVERKVGLGSWEGEALAKRITINSYNNIDGTINQHVVGFMKRFRFEKSGTDQDGKWIMHEYSLNPSLFPSHWPIRDYVVCRIRKNDRTVKLQKKRKEREEKQQKYCEEQKGNQRNKKTRTEPKENIQKQICEQNNDNQIIPQAKCKEETNMSMDNFCSWLETNLSCDQEEKSEGNKDNQIILAANKSKEEEPSMDDFCSWLEKTLSSDQEEKNEGNKDNQIILAANKSKEEDPSMDDFCSWLEKNLSCNNDQGEKNEGNFAITNVNDEEYFNMPISNMLDNIELFLEEVTESSIHNFSLWEDKFLRLGEEEWQKMLQL